MKSVYPLPETRIVHCCNDSFATHSSWSSTIRRSKRRSWHCSRHWRIRWDSTIAFQNVVVRVFARQKCRSPTSSFPPLKIKWYEKYWSLSYIFHPNIFDKSRKNFYKWAFNILFLNELHELKWNS